jgi:SAM-dependent methyltransferase
MFSNRNRTLRYRTLLGSVVAALLACVAVAAAHAQGLPAGSGQYEPVVGQPGKDVVWVPTPDEVVQAMLDLAQVGGNDYVVDLGSGDGKIAIAAARRGARALGIEYNPEMVEVSRRNAEAAAVPNVKFVQGDIFESDFSNADVVTLYLLPSLNERLKPILLRMRPGTRVASHQFTMGDWEPDKVAEVSARRALMWVVPANVAGVWAVQADNDWLNVEFEQRYQRLEGTAKWGEAQARPLRDPRVAGGHIDFAAADARGAWHRFSGTAGHEGRIAGTVVGPDGRERAFSAKRTWEPRK